MSEHTPKEPLQTPPENEHTENPPPEAASAPGFDRAAMLTALGERLRQAREQRGESIEAIVRELKLRRVYVEALERGDWDALPDEVYAIGFLKQYAAHLGIDASREISRLRGEGVRLTRPLTYPDPPLAPSRRWAWIAGAAFVVLFIAFNLGGSRQDGEDTPPAPQPSPAPLAAHAPKVPTTNDDARAVAEPARSSLAALKAPMPSLPEPAARPTNAAAPAAGPPAERPTGQPAPAQQAPSPAPEAAHRFVFEAVDEPVWLQVYPPDPYAETPAPAAHPAREALLQPGQKLRLKQPLPRVWLTTGNAGALRVEIDGKTVIAAGELGKPAQVRHKIPMPPLLDSARR